MRQELDAIAEDAIRPAYRRLNLEQRRCRPVAVVLLVRKPTAGPGILQDQIVACGRIPNALHRGEVWRERDVFAVDVLVAGRELELAAQRLGKLGLNRQDPAWEDAQVIPAVDVATHVIAELLQRGHQSCACSLIGTSLDARAASAAFSAAAPAAIAAARRSSLDFACG